MTRGAVTIGFPYRHSTGWVVGRALAALRDAVILGGRCARCGVVSMPAREWCEACGGGTADLVTVGPGGTVGAVARIHSSALRGTIEEPMAWSLVRLDGAGTDLVHLVRGHVDAGARVRPVWRAERRGAITDIVCFEAGEAPAYAAAPEDPGLVEVFERDLSLPYTLSAGALLSRFYASIAAERRLHGVRCTSCGLVLVPPVVACARCWAPTEGWVPVADRGIVTTFVVVNVPFHGQEMPLPYVLARVLLDGADTSILHVLGDVEPAAVRMGMRVAAIWRVERRGFPNDDIRHFRPTGEPDAPLETFVDRL